MHYDLLVIGAGPAGCAAALQAARLGLAVALVDRAEFPRDKACGDALIPDALRALAALDLTTRILPRASHAPGLTVYAPNGSSASLRGESACIPRQVLDNTLREAAVQAGANFLAPLKATAPTINGHAITGAVFRDLHTQQECRISARLTLLATGAAADPLVRFGVCRRTEPSATAARVYVEVPPGVAATVRDLLISFDRSICPGYGWIFPGPNSTFNVGVGYFYDARRLPSSHNVRVLLDRFLNTFPPALELVRHATSVSPLRDAPLRTAMQGAAFARAGLLVIGEAAGLTYSLTGEGIGKAMESGMLAAEIASAHLLTGTKPLERISTAYEAELTARFARKFKGYRKAQAFLSSPMLVNLLSRRANSGRFVREQLEAMFADTDSPNTLFSPLGLVRAVCG